MSELKKLSHQLIQGIHQKKHTLKDIGLTSLLAIFTQKVHVKAGFHPRSDQLHSLHSIVFFSAVEVIKDNILIVTENLIISQWSQEKKSWNMGERLEVF